MPKLGNWEIGPHEFDGSGYTGIYAGAVAYVLENIAGLDLDQRLDASQYLGAPLDVSPREVIDFLNAVKTTGRSNFEDMMHAVQERGHPCRVLHHRGVGYAFNYMHSYGTYDVRIEHDGHRKRAQDIVQCAGIVIEQAVLVAITVATEGRGMTDNASWHRTDNFATMAKAFPTLNWRTREHWRFQFGSYQQVPWLNSLPPIDGHFAHLSLEDGAMIAYTPDDAKGSRDIQVRTKPGRYLSKFYPHLDTKEVQRLAAMATALVVELRFATTPEDIVRVYKNGPGSCMSHSESDYSCRVNGQYFHPVNVYGNSDLQVAFLGAEDFSKIGARCLVWPDKKLHGRVYGDEHKMHLALSKAGYRYGSLNGARIRRIKCDPVSGYSRNSELVVMPYIDNAQSFDEVDKDWLCIGGDYPADMTSGIGALEQRVTCDYCEESCDETYTVYVERRRTAEWCEHCCDSNAFYCEDSDNRYSIHDHEQVDIHVREWRAVYVEEPGYSDRYHYYPTDRYIASFVVAECNAQRSNDYFFCERNQQWYCANTVRKYDMDHGETWSQEAFDDEGITVNGIHYARGDEPSEDQLELPVTSVTAEPAPIGT